MRFFTHSVPVSWGLATRLDPPVHPPTPMDATEAPHSKTSRRKAPAPRRGSAGELQCDDALSHYDTETLSLLSSTSERARKAGAKLEAADAQKRLQKMKDYLGQCEAAGTAGDILTKMRKVIVRLAVLGEKPAFARWTQARDRKRRDAFFQTLYRRLRRRGKWQRKIDLVQSRRRAEALAHEDDERVRLWSQICRKQVSKVARIMTQTIAARQYNARRVAALCSREQNKAAAKLQKTEAKDFSARSRKAMREMLQFWKRNEREEKELRKRAEKEAAERRRLEEEQREARRQEKKLQFLITQTELYSHFIARKAGSTLPTTSVKKLTAGVDFADIDDSTLAAHAQAAAQAAVDAERQKLKLFDTESDKHRMEAGGDTSTLGQDLDSLDFKAPSTLTESQVEVRQPRMLQCQLKGYQVKGLTWLAHLYEQVRAGRGSSYRVGNQRDLGRRDGPWEDRPGDITHGPPCRDSQHMGALPGHSPRIYPAQLAAGDCKIRTQHASPSLLGKRQRSQDTPSLLEPKKALQQRVTLSHPHHQLPAGRRR